MAPATSLHENTPPPKPVPAKANQVSTTSGPIARGEGITLLRYTGPPVPITARMHSTPQRPFKGEGMYSERGRVLVRRVRVGCAGVRVTGAHRG
eukprot:9503247-Pyramimonas_sp.AAC.1